MSRAIVQIGPGDHGKRMSLEKFDRAEGKEGFNYELNRGEIIFGDVPDWRHGLQVDNAREQFSAHRKSHTDQIYFLAHGGECKILLAEAESERHPDLAIYKSPPVDDQNVWVTWIPEIVIEVVSPSSRQRDYVDKRKEYLDFGVREYWIIDHEQQQMTTFRRVAGRWVERVVRSNESYQTRLLPELVFDLKRVFDAPRK